MSDNIDLMVWACDARRTGPLSTNERVVLAVLARYTQPNRPRSSADRAAIMEHTGMSNRTAWRALAGLLEKGFISYGTPPRGVRTFYDVAGPR